MRLSDEQLAKYQEAHLKAFGKPISKENALVQGLALLQLVKASTRTKSPKDYKDNENDSPQRNT